MKIKTIGLVINSNSTAKDNEAHIAELLSIKHNILEVQRSEAVAKKYFKLKKVDYYYKIGATDDWKLTVFLLLFSRAKIVIHWIGTDVLYHTEKVKVRLLFRFINLFPNRVVHLAVAQHLISELAKSRLKARLLPIVPSNFDSLKTGAVKKKQIVTYIPESRQDFYGASFIASLARILPNDYIIIVIGSKKLNNFEMRSNIKHLGFLPYDELIDTLSESEILLRVTEHDGLPKMIIEAWMLQTIVLFNHPLEGAIPVKAPEDVLAFLSNSTINTEAIRESTLRQFNIKELLDRYNRVFI